MVINMAKCKYTGKSVMFGNKVSHSDRKTKRMQKPNLKKIKIIENGTQKKVWISTTALKSGLVTRA
jgi:large subunit ribosomal protein L28